MKILKTLGFAVGLLLLASPALAEGQKNAKSESYSFEGPFGHFDKGQLQRGYKVYKEVCSNCHAMKFVAFRNLAEAGGPGFSEEQVKALAATFTMKDGPDSNGDMFDRPGRASDQFPARHNETGSLRAGTDRDVSRNASDLVRLVVAGTRADR